MNKPETIHDRIYTKREELIGIHASIAIHMAKDLSPRQRAEARVLQDRMEYRIAEAEEHLLDSKLDIYKELLSVVRRDDI